LGLVFSELERFSAKLKKGEAMKIQIQKWGICNLMSLILMTAFLLPLAGGAEFPEKPIQILVGWSAGSQNDMIDRTVAQALQKILKQPVIIQNVPGGGGALVLGKIKTVQADGYTLFQTGTPMYSRTPHLREVPYDPLKDFAYLAQHAMFQFSIVDRVDNPWKNFEEMISYARQNPKKVMYSTAGVGTSMHLIMEYLAIRENLQWIHVPFSAITESMAAMLGGHVQIHSTSTGLSDIEHVRAGRARFLLATTPKRSPNFPDIPSILEKGYDFSVVSGACWTVPASTPKDIQRKLESALLQAFKDPTVEGVITKWLMLPEPLGSEPLSTVIAQDHKINGELMKQLGLGIYKK
jgi:tripartite-type tricarboxylate transporter receptor subunit TctC